MKTQTIYIKKALFNSIIEGTTKTIEIDRTMWAAKYNRLFDKNGNLRQFDDLRIQRDYDAKKGFILAKVAVRKFDWGIGIDVLEILEKNI